MKKLLIISVVIVSLVGACTAMLLYNKKKIDEKARLDGNLQQIPVFVAEVKTSSLDGDFEVDGSFAAMHELTLMAETQGKVKELLFNTGDLVSVGQVLARLDDDLVKAQLAFAEAALDKAKADMLKFEGLLKAGGVSSQQVEDVKLALLKSQTDVTTLRKQLEFCTIKAPIQGTITKRMIEIGSIVMPASPVAEIVDVNRLKMIANVAEGEVVHVKRGMKVNVISSLYPDVKYTGVVTAVGVKADEARRFPVEIDMVNDPIHSLKDGMFGTAVFSFEGKREAIVIPRNAIVGSIKTPKVYIVENDRAVLKEVTTGSAGDATVEITSGLTPGEMIVISGMINLDNNSAVRIVRSK
jgi:membrane fusion protein, multidrug efflux system